MLKIYLARHGQDEDNARGILNGRRDNPLTKIGYEQACKLAEHIKSTGLKFDKVYSCPLVRAYATAETITEALDLDKPTKIDGLIERDYGIMTGKPVKDIERLCAPGIIKADPIVYFLSPERAETFPGLLERADRVLSWIKNNHQDENILLVSHGDLGKMLYAAYYRLDWKKVLMMFHFGNSELLILSEDSPAENAHVFMIQQHNH